MRQLTASDLHLALDACASVIGQRVFVVVGAVSIVGAFPEPPEGLAISHDIDLYPPPDSTGEINTLLARHFGEGSLFALENGFYVEGVGRWAMMAALPDWETRLITVQTPGNVTGLCLHPLDLAYVKLEVEREKDLQYVGIMLRQNIVTREEIITAIEPLSESLRTRIEANLRRAEQSAGIHR